jgi:ribonuclease VapC
MVIDTSAIIAFLRSEPEADEIEDLLDQSADLRMSAFTALECRVVLHTRFGPHAAADFDLLVVKAGILVEPFDAEQAELAFDAYRRFGKGTGHPAQLNLGDCAAYTLAISRGLPLLYKGEDFARTDIESARSTH